MRQNLAGLRVKNYFLKGPFKGCWALFFLLGLFSLKACKPKIVENKLAGICLSTSLTACDGDTAGDFKYLHSIDQANMPKDNALDQTMQEFRSLFFTQDKKNILPKLCSHHCYHRAIASQDLFNKQGWSSVGYIRVNLSIKGSHHKGWFYHVASLLTNGKIYIVADTKEGFYTIENWRKLFTKNPNSLGFASKIQNAAASKEAFKTMTLSAKELKDTIGESQVQLGRGQILQPYFEAKFRSIYALLALRNWVTENKAPKARQALIEWLQKRDVYHNKIMESMRNKNVIELSSPLVHAFKKEAVFISEHNNTICYST